MAKKKALKGVEELVCNCGDDANHHEYVDGNNETVVECKKCLRFLKFPAKK